MRNLVAVKVMRQSDPDNWDQIGIEAYFPIFIDGDKYLKDNVEKRLKFTYFDVDPTVRKVQWNVKGSSDYFEMTLPSHPTD